MLCHNALSWAPIARHSADAARITPTVRARPPPPSPTPPALTAAARRACTNAIHGVSGGRGASEPVGRRGGARRRPEGGVGGGGAEAEGVGAAEGEERRDRGEVCEHEPCVCGGGARCQKGRCVCPPPPLPAAAVGVGGSVCPENSPPLPPFPFPPPPCPLSNMATNVAALRHWRTPNWRANRHPSWRPHSFFRRRRPPPPLLSPSHATGSRAPRTVTRASSSTRATGGGEGGAVESGGPDGGGRHRSTRVFQTPLFGKVSPPLARTESGAYFPGVWVGDQGGGGAAQA